jgi:hypothetical protein
MTEQQHRSPVVIDAKTRREQLKEILAEINRNIRRLTELLAEQK